MYFDDDMFDTEPAPGDWMNDEAYGYDQDKVIREAELQAEFDAQNGEFREEGEAA